MGRTLFILFKANNFINNKNKTGTPTLFNPFIFIKTPTASPKALRTSIENQTPSPTSVNEQIDGASLTHRPTLSPSDSPDTSSQKKKSTKGEHRNTATPKPSSLRSELPSVSPSTHFLSPPNFDCSNYLTESACHEGSVFAKREEHIKCKWDRSNKKCLMIMIWK